MYGKKIHDLRKKKGMTQKELAEKVGLSSVAILRYEKNQREPNEETLKRIAEVFEVSTSQLVDWDALQAKFDPDGKLVNEVKVIESIQNAFGEDAVKLLDLFCTLNDEGKQKCLSDMEDMTMIPKYQK